MKDKTLIANVYEIKNIDLISHVDNIIPLLDLIVNKCHLNVIEKCSYQFEPCGVTAIYLLAESHLSIHTFPEDKRVRIDLYCCNPNVEFDIALDIIYYYFNGDCKIEKKIF